MTTDSEQQYRIYKRCLLTLNDKFGVDKGEFTRIVSLRKEVNNSAISKISGKLRAESGRGVTRLDAANAQMVLLIVRAMEKMGLSVSELKYRKDGSLDPAFIKEFLSHINEA